MNRKSTPAIVRSWQYETEIRATNDFTPFGYCKDYEINTYWREGMCEEAHVEGRCPSAPGEALIDPLMLRTIRGQVGDTIEVLFTGTRRNGKVTDFPVDYTIVGTYAIDDHADTTWFNPARTFGDGTLRPPPLGSNVPLVTNL